MKRLSRSDERIPGRIDRPQKKPGPLDVSGMFRICHPGDADTAPFQVYGETLDVALERFKTRCKPVPTNTIKGERN